MKTYKLKLKLNKQQYKIIKDYCYYSNNLYNYTLYICRKYYEETNRYIGIKLLAKEVVNNKNYKLLPAQCAQQIIKLVDKNYRSFFSLYSRRLNGEYVDKVNMPNFRKKKSLFNIIYTYQTFKILKNGNISLFMSNHYKKYNKIKFKQSILSFKLLLPNIKQIKQIVIRPYNNGQYFKMFIQYEEVQNEKLNLNKNNYLSIDLGINNLATCFTNSGHSFIVNGRQLKSYNRQYNKKRAELKSEIKIKNNKYWSKKLQNLSENRFNYIDNHFNQVVNYIIKYCINNNIGNIIIGYNELWKKNINLGKINNQKFMSIPYLHLKQKLENKCNNIGITHIQINESYTSKCSFVDNELVQKQESYLGKRIKRGLFKTNSGILVNADINGSANIMKKVVSDITCNQEVLGLMLNPLKINILNY